MRCCGGLCSDETGFRSMMVQILYILSSFTLLMAHNVKDSSLTSLANIAKSERFIYNVEERDQPVYGHRRDLRSCDK